MKTVQIVNGTYGHRPAGAKRIIPIFLGETVALPDAEAERLVALNVAVYTMADDEESTATGTDAEQDTIADFESLPVDAEEVDSSYLDAEHLKKSMKMEELKRLANDLGIDTTGLDTKAKLADAISQVHGTPDDESETPPILTAEEPV